MPSPALNKTLAITSFQGFQIQLPPKAGVAPGEPSLTTSATLTTMSTLAAPAIRGATAIVSTPMSVPPALFRAASNTASDIATQKAMHDGYTELMNSLCDAIRFAWDQFRLQARFQHITIMAASAIGGPGCLAGPSFETLIKTAPSVAAWTGWWAGVRDAVAKGFATSWQEWQSKVTVPGLPWYPMFVAFPGPMAPPTPNVPTPLVACASAGVSSMSAGVLKQNLSLRLGGKMNYHEQFSAALANVLSVTFLTWVAAQQVTLVMGKGPVPNFAPPYVPVGPVSGGDIISVPGHLMS